MFEQNFENRNILNHGGGRNVVANPFREGSQNFSHHDPNDRRDMQQAQVLRIANAEIEELKEGLNHAEYQLAKALREKEGIEDDARQQNFKVQALNQ